MGKLFFTCSPARAGKSTFAKEWGNQVGRVVVSGDQLRLALHGNRYSAYAEATVFATLQVMVRTLLQSGYDVLIDETNTTKESVKRILEIDSEAQPIFISTDIETCRMRAINTGQSDLCRVIDGHFANLEKIRQEYGSYEEMMRVCRQEIEERWGQNEVPNIVKFD